MDDAERMAAWLAGGIVVVLILVLSVTAAMYAHPMPGKDCKPYIYPICFRAVTPPADQPPSTIAVYLSILLVILIAILLIYVSYHASVTEQKALITGAVEKPPTTTPAQGVEVK